VGAGAGGVWQGVQAGQLAVRRDGGWLILTPQEGWRAWHKGQNALLVYRAGAWAILTQEVSAIGLLARQPDGALQARSLQAGPGITITAPAAAPVDPTIALNLAANLSWTGTHSFSASISSASINSAAQIGAFNWLGDIDGAKWSSKLGGYRLSFASDSTWNTGMLGADCYIYEGRTFRVKMRLDGAGLLETLGGFSVNGTQIVNAEGHLSPRAYPTTSLPPVGPFGTLIAISGAADNKILAVSDGAVWCWLDGTAV
jgi:Protein of unknown function (DUF2793)